ncbi:hypothetical protein EDC01DRAFT_627291 [Geopyxis carbonaria]|nr:hypothetical protein EDC01DRAFT_627291 [Geopyxis carbonaria]
MGNRATSYCEYCLIKGFWNSGTYCPHQPPNNIPVERISAELKKPDITRYLFINYNDFPATLREHRQYLDFGNHVVRYNDKEYATAVGIKGIPLLSNLPSIVLPWSFPFDIMHLFYENITVKLNKIYRGVFLPVSNNNNSTQPTKAKDTGEPWVLNPVQWEQLSEWINMSRSTWPTEFGCNIVPILDHCTHLTASEWKVWTYHLAPIYMQSLPFEDYSQLISLTLAMLIMEQAEITPEQLDDAEAKIYRFSSYYERRFYQYNYNRLRLCLPVFHQLRHTAQCIRLCGPPLGYSQWTMERCCFKTSRSAKSKVLANQNIANISVHREQASFLPFAMSFANNIHETDEDKDGAVPLEAILIRQLTEQTGTDDAALIDSSPPPVGLDNPRQYELTDIASVEHKAQLGRNATIALKSFLNSQDALSLASKVNPIMPLPDIMQDTFRKWWTCNVRFWGDRFEKPDEAFKIVSANRADARRTRAASMVHFSDLNPGQIGELFFGQVQFFFSIDTMGEKGIQLAYVHTFPWERDSNNNLLIHKSKATSYKIVIRVEQIDGLIGQIYMNGREYLVHKKSAIWHRRE